MKVVVVVDATRCNTQIPSSYSSCVPPLCHCPFNTGIGIGATEDPKNFGSAFIAIAVHKFFTAYALGSSLVCAGYWDRGHRMGFYIQTGIFIGITIVGIGIGWAAAEAASDKVTSAVLVAITAGSFIFVGAMEIAPIEMATVKGMKINPTLPIVCFLLGYCVMSLLAIWA